MGQGFTERHERIDRAANVLMSKMAFGMWRVAICLADFDPVELWDEIKSRRGRNPGARINEPTVLNAMQRVYERY